MRLSAVLSPRDLPEAELRAARLDGEVFAVGSCFCPIDEIEGPGHRAGSLIASLPAPLIADRRTAAWVHGACRSAPHPVELCADIGARRHRVPSSEWDIREVVIAEEEITVIHGLLVTVPLRTAIDLARFSPDFGPAERGIVRSLGHRGGFGYERCAAEIESRRNLPLKRRALERLALSLR